MEKLQLIPIKIDNIDFYLSFEKSYKENLYIYQSRIYPKDYKKYQQLFDESRLSWFYIVFEEKYIGSVWLEKLSKEDTSATLGIFIAYNNFRGLGIGQKVIEKIINYNCAAMSLLQIELNVRANNLRAIRCYINSGFIESEKNIKNGIGVNHMIYTFSK